MSRTLLLFLFIPFAAFSQQVTFCENVDNAGNPQNASTEFTIGNKGGFFKILVKLSKPVASRGVIFDVYNTESGKEIFNNSLRMDVNPVLTWFYKEITFFNAGTFHVYVYDERDKLLGVGQVVINKK